jgi:hypothetical protein
MTDGEQTERDRDIETIERLRALGAKRVKVGEIEVEFGPGPVARGGDDDRGDIAADGSIRREPQNEEETLEGFTKEYLRDALRSST